MTMPGDDSNPLTNAPGVVQLSVDDQHQANSGTIKETSPTSVPVNSEPVREDQVQNAVKFLSHPNVKGSPVMYRRSFLERKGLTKEEIDEAFLRVPDPAPTVSAVHPTTITQDNEMKPVATVAGGNTNQGILLRSRFRWWHAFAAIGFLAISGAGTAVIFKRSIVPRLRSWIRKIVFEEEEEAAKYISGKHSLLEEAAAAAKAAEAAASDLARARQEMLTSKGEERKCFEELTSLLVMQVQEMKSMSNVIQKLQGNTSAPHIEQDQRLPVTDSRVRARLDLWVTASWKHSLKIGEINDMPPNPSQPLSTPRLAPRPKPWEGVQTQSSITQILQKNPKITEIENEDEFKTPSAEMLVAHPFRPSWVPPQPPPVAIPESSAAIRQPKKRLSRNSSTANDQLSTIDELPRITKVDTDGLNPDITTESFESRGQVYTNGGRSGLNISENEIQDEHKAYSKKEVE